MDKYDMRDEINRIIEKAVAEHGPDSFKGLAQSMREMADYFDKIQEESVYELLHRREKREKIDFDDYDGKVVSLFGDKTDTDDDFDDEEEDFDDEEDFDEDEEDDEDDDFDWDDDDDWDEDPKHPVEFEEGFTDGYFDFKDELEDQFDDFTYNVERLENFCEVSDSEEAKRLAPALPHLTRAAEIFTDLLDELDKADDILDD